jgi:hypothetical protein
VHFLSANVRLERGLGRRQIDDDVGNVFLDSDLLKRLVGSDSRIP